MTERLTEKITNKETGEVLLYRLKGQWGEIGDNRMRATKKLGELEDAEEDGRLVVLPCKVGSVAYSICHRYTKCSKYGESFEEYSCSGCEELNCDSHKEYYIHVNQSVSLEWIIRNMQLGNFGKTVFPTREETEKALKEMESDN